MFCRSAEISKKLIGNSFKSFVYNIPKMITTDETYIVRSEKFFTVMTIHFDSE